MKTVVITGSSRGLGFEMAKCFRQNGFNVVINGTNSEKLSEAKAKLESIKAPGKVIAFAANVTVPEYVRSLMEYAVENCGGVDIWINNAGVNQPMKPIWELTDNETDQILNIDLKGTIIGSKVAMGQMIEQGCGAIYNVEGYGSNDAMMLGLNMYGTSKRAVTHFTRALAKESEEIKTNVIVGRLSPGIMITDFTTNSLSGKEKIDLPEKTKKIYNILGDYPDIVADFLVKRMIKNTKNNAHIVWLTGSKAAWRFMTAASRKNKFYK